MKISDKIQQINMSNNIILNVSSLISFSINKKDKEIFQRNSNCNINLFNECEKSYNKHADNLGMLLYIIIQSSITIEIFERWEECFNNIILD